MTPSLSFGMMSFGMSLKMSKKFLATCKAVDVVKRREKVFQHQKTVKLVFGNQDMFFSVCHGLDPDAAGVPFSL
jgi:hypothetical protein